MSWLRLDWIGLLFFQGFRCISGFEGEADFDTDLPVLDFTVDDVAADFADFHPAHVTHRFGCCGDGILCGCFDRIPGRTDQFYFFVYVITHDESLSSIAGIDNPFFMFGILMLDQGSLRTYFGCSKASWALS